MLIATEIIQNTLFYLKIYCQGWKTRRILHGYKGFVSSISSKTLVIFYTNYTYKSQTIIARFYTHKNYMAHVINQKQVIRFIHVVQQKPCFTLVLVMTKNKTKKHKSLSTNVIFASSRIVNIFFMLSTIHICKYNVTLWFQWTYRNH